MQSDLAAAGVSGESLHNLHDFFRCIAICHDCVTVKHKSVEGKLNYNGPSVDEVALHDMAQEAGIGFFVEKDSSGVKLKLDGQFEEYEILKSFPFDSVRKCMSVIVKDPKNAGKAIVFVKGADSSVFPMIQRSKVSSTA